MFTKPFWKVLIPAAVLLVALLAAAAIRKSSPEPESRPQRTVLPSVEATRLTRVDYPVFIKAQGIVEPTVATTLVPEVTGTVVELSDNFVVGGSFAAGEVLVQVDERDYRIALTQAQATLAQNRAQLLEQQALAEQAVNEWRALGRRGEPSSLTLREPQVAAAQANLDAAQAQVERARLDLTRTRIVAPYAGRVLERQTQLGEFVSRGAPIGRIHTEASVNVRLPLGSQQLSWLPLPASGFGASSAAQVQIHGRVAAARQHWDAQLIRAEGIDAATQQLDVIARVDAPFADIAAPLRPGQFVDATIEGSVLESVFVIPRSAVRERREVLVLDENLEVHRREISIAWSDDEVFVVNGGLVEQEILVLTRLAVVADGTPVRATIDGELAPALEEAPAIKASGALGGG